MKSEGEDDSSAEEIQAIKSLKGQSRAPDTFDVSPTFGILASAAGASRRRTSLRPGTRFPVGHEGSRRATGSAPYWGAISFGTNTKIVKTPPKSWDDLRARRTRA